MSGELAFYDRKTLKCLGIVDAHMTVNYGWSPDSLYFLTAILFPRLRVENGFRVWYCARPHMAHEPRQHGARAGQPPQLRHGLLQHRRPRNGNLFGSPLISELKDGERMN